MHTDMLEYLGRNWGWIVLRGVIAALFGVLAIAWPGITLAALVIVWGAYALADGVLALIAAWQVRDQGRPFWALVVVGLLGFAAGVVTFLWPGITALALLMVSSIKFYSFKDLHFLTREPFMTVVLAVILMIVVLAEPQVMIFTFAVSYAKLGNKDQAFAWLEKAYVERSPWLTFIKADPDFDKIRPDPRFAELTKRMGLP